MKQNEESLRRAWGVSIVLALIGFFLFLRPYLGVLALAALIAYLFNPLYKKLIKKKWPESRAALATLVVSFLALVLPFSIILLITVQQVNVLMDRIRTIQQTSDTQGINEFFSQTVTSINQRAEDLTGVHELIKLDSATETIKQYLPKVLDAVSNIIFDVVGGLPQFFILILIYLMAFYSFLIYQKRIIETIKYMSPFPNKINDRYLRRIGLMTNGMVKGQFVIAIIQGFLSALAMLLLGLDDFFFFLFLLFTLMSFIPLGAGILTIPIGIIAILTGNIWQGLVVLANHFFVVSTVDNIIRPKVVPKEIGMPAILTLLAAFAGVAYFGFLGVIYGPIIMIVITTTISTYVEYRKGIENG